MDYIFSNITSFQFSFFAKFLFLPEEFIFMTLLETVYEFLIEIILAVIFFNDVLIFFVVRTVKNCTISIIVPIFNRVVARSLY